jgi:hypothetical protein
LQEGNTHSSNQLVDIFGVSLKTTIEKHGLELFNLAVGHSGKQLSRTHRLAFAPRQGTATIANPAGWRLGFY